MTLHARSDMVSMSVHFEPDRLQREKGLHEHHHFHPGTLIKEEQPAQAAVEAKSATKTHAAVEARPAQDAQPAVYGPPLVIDCPECEHFLNPTTPADIALYGHGPDPRFSTTADGIPKTPDEVKAVERAKEGQALAMTGFGAALAQIMSSPAALQAFMQGQQTPAGPPVLHDPRVPR